MTLSLNVKTRTEVGRKINSLRRGGRIPAVVYGHGFKNHNITVSKNDFQKVFKEAGESSLINLVIDDHKPIQVLTHNLQYDPLTNNIQHIDFYQVRVDEKITAEIGLKFEGEAPAVKDLSGILITPVTKLKIECLPKDLVHELTVDLSSLKTFDDIIRLKDISFPSGIKIIGSLDEVIALVKAPRSEEEIKQLEEKPEGKIEEIKTVKEEQKGNEAEATEPSQGSSIKENKDKKL